MDSPSKPSSPARTSAADLPSSSVLPEPSIAPTIEGTGASTPPSSGNRPPNPSDQRSPDRLEEERINLEEAAFEEPLAAVAGLLPPSPEILLRNLRKKRGARIAVPKGTPQELSLQLNW